MTNPLTWVGNEVSGLFGFNDDKAAADAAKAKLQAAIASGGLQASAQFGVQGQGLQNQAASLANQNVGVDWSKVGADDARLAAVRQHYQDQFRDGGPAAQAAIQAAQSARGLTAHGGVAGIREDTLGSAGTQAQVAQTAQGEMTDAGNAATQLDSQKAAMALQRSVLQAQASHANFTKTLAAQQASFDLTNTQQRLANEAQAAANQLSYQEGNTSLNYGQDQFNTGKALTDFLTSAVTKGAGTLSSMGSAASTATPISSGVSTAVPTAVLPTSVAPANYITPSVTMGRTAVPIFSTQPTLPTSANFFNRGT